MDQNIRYQCQIFCAFKFNKKASYISTRNLWLYNSGEYTFLARDIEATDWGALKDDDTDVFANNVTDCIINQAKKHTPGKSVNIRQTDPPLLNKNIRNIKRKSKPYFDKYKETSNLADSEKYKQLRNQVTREIRNARKIQTDKLAIYLKNSNIRPRD